MLDVAGNLDMEEAYSECIGYMQIHSWFLQKAWTWLKLDTAHTETNEGSQAMWFPQKFSKHPSTYFSAPESLS